MDAVYDVKWTIKHLFLQLNLILELIEKEDKDRKDLYLEHSSINDKLETRLFQIVGIFLSIVLGGSIITNFSNPSSPYIILISVMIIFVGTIRWRKNKQKIDKLLESLRIINEKVTAPYKEARFFLIPSILNLSKINKEFIENYVIYVQILNFCNQTKKIDLLNDLSCDYITKNKLLKIAKTSRELQIKRLSQMPKKFDDKYEYPPIGSEVISEIFEKYSIELLNCK